MRRVRFKEPFDDGSFRRPTIPDWMAIPPLPVGTIGTITEEDANSYTIHLCFPELEPAERTLFISKNDYSQLSVIEFLPPENPQVQFLEEFDNATWGIVELPANVTVPPIPPGKVGQILEENPESILLEVTFAELDPPVRRVRIYPRDFHKIKKL